MLHAVSTSDWHLEALRAYFPFDHIERQLKEIDKVYEYAGNKGLNKVFVPGDISDKSTMGGDTHIQLLKFFTKYDGVMDTYYVSGNHDIHDQHKTSMDFFKALCDIGYFKTFHIFQQSEQRIIDDITCNFVAYPSNEVIPSKQPCLNFAHVEYAGAIGDNGRPMRKASSRHTISVPKRDYTVSGHIHKHQEMKKERAIYVGNPYQKNFGEDQTKGFIEFKAAVVKGKMKFKYQQIRTKPEFSFNTIEINEQADFAKISKSRGALTRLYLSDEVLLPEDLRMRYPNIAQIHRKNGASLKVLTNNEEFKQHTAEIPSIDPLKGLVEFLTGIDMRKKEIKSAISMVREALSEIG